MQEKLWRSVGLNLLRRTNRTVFINPFFEGRKRGFSGPAASKRRFQGNQAVPPTVMFSMRRVG
ncbi:hypothetical protein R77567_00188 [Ralstonia sp. LMG 32965]|uniref:Uncharacterized protein n=1 Tax=Ralstonia flatus TaxID=3058601 RepID=A0AAD2BV39_9RALS|nr:hypothetical protein R77567_00188 [Ralstonia sp. LMG 32965]CAJ0858314.1 hypothetical protein R77564_00550 [Ralstonia sp. LMG 32965]